MRDIRNLHVANGVGKLEVRGSVLVKDLFEARTVLRIEGINQARYAGDLDTVGTVRYDEPVYAVERHNVARVVPFWPEGVPLHVVKDEFFCGPLCETDLDVRVVTIADGQRAEF